MGREKEASERSRLLSSATFAHATSLDWTQNGALHYFDIGYGPVQAHECALLGRLPLSPTAHVALSRAVQQAVLQHYPDAQVAYRFTNRGKTPFSRAAFNDIKASIARGSLVRARRPETRPDSSAPDLATLSLTPKEHAWLEKRCSFFTPSYLAFLASFRFNPEAQVTLTFVPEDTDQAEGDERGSLRIELKGLWSEVIPYEVGFQLHATSLR